MMIRIIAPIALLLGIFIGLTIIEPGTTKNPPCDPNLYPGECPPYNNKAKCSRGANPGRRDCFPGRRQGSSTWQNNNPSESQEEK